ncbi:MAG: N-acetylmuramoyl-L-alanine amidase [Rhodospirillales bacterium]|nr:N-acetylmuramoyl-L-alanine amidase [Rhodospirillales bacterium]
MIKFTPSPNADDRPSHGMIDMLVLHYTGMETSAAAQERLMDPNAKVSAHYVVDEDGDIAQLVDEHQRAWHAGVSWWRGHTAINDRSIGIELVNPGHEFGYRPFPEAQMRAVIGLAGAIVRRHPIPARNVVGHSDVAPTRKMDPGELFDWSRLAAAGIGLWPGESDVCIMDPAVIQDMLARVGYDVRDWALALKAFQRHYRPMRVTGRIDFETARRLRALVDLCEG